MEITISNKGIFKTLLIIIIVLVVLSMLGQIYIYFLGGHNRYLVKLFNLDMEYNIPTWYQSMTLLLCSIFLLAIAFNKKKIGDRFRLHWLFLGVLFFLLSLDELLQFHEQLSTPLRKIFHVNGYLHFAWVIPAILFLIAFGIFYLKFIIYLPRKYRNLFIVAGIVYVIGTVGFELIGGDIQEIYSQKTFLYAIMTNVEETFEMVGILIFIYALIDYLSVNIGVIKLRITSKLDGP